MLSGIPYSQTCWKQSDGAKEPQAQASISCPFQTMTLVQNAGWKGINAQAVQIEGALRDKCCHRWEQGCSACPRAVLPKLLPNPFQSQERTPSMYTMGTTGGFFVSFLFLCVPVTDHIWIRGRHLRHQESTVGTADSELSPAPTLFIATLERVNQLGSKAHQRYPSFS